MIPGAAEDDAVRAWKHVTAAQITVINLRLWQQHFKLTTHRHERFILEKLTRTNPVQLKITGSRNERAPHDSKFLHYNSAAGNVKSRNNLLR